MIDTLALYLSNHTPERDAFVKGFLGAIAPGANGVVLSARLLLDIHDDPAMAHAAGLGCRDLLADSRAAHAAVAEGHDVPRSTWSALRARAIDEAGQNGGIALAIGDLVERTAWPINRSRSLLAEGMTTLLRLSASLAVQESGWSPQDQQRVDEILEGIEREAAARGEQQPNFPALFAERDPELEARFRAQLHHHSQAFLASTRRWAARLIALAEAAR